ncbi:MAG: hypothetical protein AAF802_25675 [Planctomycetota bacterium]
MTKRFIANGTQSSSKDGLSRNDRALIAVSVYLRRFGIEHPKVLHDISNKSVALAHCEGSKLEDENAFVEQCLSNALDQLSELYDHWSAEFATKDEASACLVGIHQFLADPAAFTTRPIRHAGQLANRLERQNAVVIPVSPRRPMIRNTTPPIFALLRPSWWRDFSLACVAAISGADRRNLSHKPIVK